MAQLPSGTVTLLFTDIEGSTRLLERLGDAYASVLADHQEILRNACHAHHGCVVDTQGDSFFVVFGRAAASALRAQMGAPIPPVNCAEHQTAVNALTSQMGADQFQAEWMRGQQLGAEEAIAYARQEEPPGGARRA